jgi:hypothetical protein
MVCEFEYLSRWGEIDTTSCNKVTCGRSMVFSGYYHRHMGSQPRWAIWREIWKWSCIPSLLYCISRKNVNTEYMYYSWCMTSTDIVKWFPRNLAENSEAASFLYQTTSFETEVQEREPWDFYEWITCNEKPRCAPNIFPTMFWREI